MIMSDSAHITIDRLDQLCKPMVIRSLAMIASICVVLVGLHVWSLWASRIGELDSTGTSTANMARALASHAERSIGVADAILDEMVDRADGGKLETVPEAQLHRRLARIAAATPEIQELFLYDANGERRATSLPKRLAGSNADREFFQYHRTRNDPGTYIGRPIRSRSSGILTIPVSRRINLPDGSFGGVAMASLRLDFFGAFYDSFDVGKTGTIILAIDDGTLLYRRPFSQAMVGTDISGGPIFHLYRKSGPIGTAMLTSRIDGIERLYSYRHVDGYPLLVAIAQSREEILGDWWAAVIKMSGVVLFALGLLAWGAQRMVRQLQLREALEDQLRLARARLEAQNVALQEQADSDGLTGLANRRHFERKLAAEKERARRSGQPCSLILADVDHFKKFNDRYGHVLGDDCLRRVAHAIGRSTRRPADLAARYGGEEFALILPETDEEGACAVAENIRAAVAALRIAHGDSAVGHVTLSLGVHTAYARDDAGTGADWVALADAMLYQAKAQGRNRVAARGAAVCT